MVGNTMEELLQKTDEDFREIEAQDFLPENDPKPLLFPLDPETVIDVSPELETNIIIDDQVLE